MACRLVGAKPLSEPMLDVVNWTLRDKLQWNLYRNSNIFIQANTFESVVCEIAAILSRPQCVKTKYKALVCRYGLIYKWARSKNRGVGERLHCKGNLTKNDSSTADALPIFRRTLWHLSGPENRRCSAKLTRKYKGWPKCTESKLWPDSKIKAWVRGKTYSAKEISKMIPAWWMIYPFS